MPHQDRNDLFFRMPFALHRPVLSSRTRLQFALDHSRGNVTGLQQWGAPEPPAGIWLACTAAKQQPRGLIWVIRVDLGLLSSGRLMPQKLRDNGHRERTCSANSRREHVQQLACRHAPRDQVPPCCPCTRSAIRAAVSESDQFTFPIKQYSEKTAKSDLNCINSLRAVSERRLASACAIGPPKTQKWPLVGLAPQVRRERAVKKAQRALAPRSEARAAVAGRSKPVTLRITRPVHVKAHPACSLAEAASEPQGRHARRTLGVAGTTGERSRRYNVRKWNTG
jgi:hypothetical protein